MISTTLPAAPMLATTEAVLLSVADLARMLSCSVRHVWRLRDAGELPAPIKLGKLIRWRREAVMRFLDEAAETRRR
jgi:excisionase family DNA binding protein